MGKLTTLKRVELNINEILFYAFFSIMLFSKGMGWYDGMREYKICLILGVGCLLLKLIFSHYTLPQFIITALLGGLGVLSYAFSHEKGMLICMMLIIGIKDIPVLRVFKIGAVIWVCVFSYRVYAFLTDIDRGILLVHEKMGLGHIFRWSMGYPHPNVFHISYVILLTVLFYVFRIDGKKMRIAILLAFLGNCFIFLYSVSFTGFLLTMVYLLLVVYFEMRRRLSKPEKLCVLCVLPLCLAFSMVAPLLPEESKPFLALNKMMNTRLVLSRYFLLNERISLLGQQIIVPQPDLTIDNSYLFALMTYGAIVFVILMIAYFFMIRYALEEDKRKELAITLGLLIAGVSEPFLFNTSFKNMSLLFVGNYLFHHAEYFHNKFNTTRVGIANLGDSYLQIPEALLVMMDKGKNMLITVVKIIAKKRVLLVTVCLIIGLGGGIYYSQKLVMPQAYVLPVNICDYSEQTPFFLTAEEKEEEEINGVSIPCYVDDKTPMYRFDGNIVKVEWAREVIGHVVLFGVCGIIPGAGIALIIGKGKRE